MIDVAFLDVIVDGDKLDAATAETLEAAMDAAAELATDANTEPESVALTLLWNSLLSLPDGEAFIRSMTTFQPTLPVPALPKGQN